MKLRIALYNGTRRIRVLYPVSTLTIGRQALANSPTGSIIEIYLDGAWEPYE